MVTEEARLVRKYECAQFLSIKVALLARRFAPRPVDLDHQTNIARRSLLQFNRANLKNAIVKDMYVSGEIGRRAKQSVAISCTNIN